MGLNKSRVECRLCIADFGAFLTFRISFRSIDTSQDTSTDWLQDFQFEVSASYRVSFFIKIDAF